MGSPAVGLLFRACSGRARRGFRTYNGLCHVGYGLCVDLAIAVSTATNRQSQTAFYLCAVLAERLSKARRGAPPSDGDATGAIPRRKPPKVWFCQRTILSEPTLIEPRFKVYWMPARRTVSNKSAHRWDLCRVTVHVSRPHLPSPPAACTQPDLRTTDVGALSRAAVAGVRRLAPTLTLPHRPTALAAPERPLWAGWWQARVQVSARAPLEL